MITYKSTLLFFPLLQRQIDVYHLVPNTTYIFRVWATNKLGKGEIVEVEGHTHYTDTELGNWMKLSIINKHLFAYGIKINLLIKIYYNK